MFTDDSMKGKVRRCCWSFDLAEELIPQGTEEESEAWKDTVEAKLLSKLPDGDVVHLYTDRTSKSHIAYPCGKKFKGRVNFHCDRKLSGVTSDWDDEIDKYEDFADQVWEDLYDVLEDSLIEIFGEDMPLTASFQINPRYWLYWMETPGSEEDWFAVGDDEYATKRFFDDYEGYSEEYTDDDGDIVVEEGGSIYDTWTQIGEEWPVPDEYVDENPTLFDKGPFHPSNELIEACGGTLVRAKEPMVVEFKDYKGEREHFVQGDRDHVISRYHDDQFEASGRGRPNGTDPLVIN